MIVLEAADWAHTISLETREQQNFLQNIRADKDWKSYPIRFFLISGDMLSSSNTAVATFSQNFAEKTNCFGRTQLPA